MSTDRRDTIADRRKGTGQNGVGMESARDGTTGTGECQKRIQNETIFLFKKSAKF